MPEYTITLPTLHEGQVGAFELLQQHQFVAVRCGRRWGKTDLGKVIACDGAINQELIGWFAPDYKTETEAYNEILDTLEPLKKPGTSKNDGLIRLRTNGRIDFWTLENDRAGRSRKYHKVIIDEAAFTKANMIDVWERSIKPTLLDYNGQAIVCSNTNGVDSSNFFWKICNQPELGFVEYHAPTWQNPYVPERIHGETKDQWLERLEAYKEKLLRESHPLVYQQEYEAAFVDWSGVAFFALDKLLERGAPVPFPDICDIVFATVDTATKTGKEHDGTAVTYWALSRHFGYPLIVLDWEIVQIEGGVLDVWLAKVFERLEERARQCRARMGSIGAFIEDKNVGTTLLQQGLQRNWPVHAIDSRLTAMGKDERAIDVSGYVYGDKVRLSQHAYDKSMPYKGVARNHFRAQVIGYRVGNKDPHAQDDLLDTFCYGCAIGLGDRQGF